MRPGWRLPPSAVIYECRVTHVRAHPVRNTFSYPACLWLVDVADLPCLWPLASFPAADHAGEPGLPLRQHLDRLLAGQGVDLRGGRIMMLGAARALGYGFSPLTVYWCHRPSGALECVIAEVHNTYQQLHRYLVRPDHRGRADVAKQFYVSPYYPVDGHYRMSLPLPAERLALQVTLHRPDGHVFAASLRGWARPCGPSSVVRALARHPLPTLSVSARIRWQATASGKE